MGSDLIIFSSLIFEQYFRLLRGSMARHTRRSDTAKVSRTMDFQTIVSFKPPVIGLFTDPKSLAYRGCGVPLAEKHFGFQQLADDLFGCITTL
jgi:hypothetical protein